MDKYKAAWEELRQRMIAHGKMYPNSDLCTIPWNMMKGIEAKHGILISDSPSSSTSSRTKSRTKDSLS